LEGALGVGEGVEVDSGVVAGAGVLAGVGGAAGVEVECGGRCSAGGVAGAAIAEMCTGVEGTTTGAGSGAVWVLLAVALRTPKPAANTTTTMITAATAARPPEAWEVELMRDAWSSAAAPGHSQRSGFFEPGARQRWTLVKLACAILYSM
jgi:hypothetical protein